MPKRVLTVATIVISLYALATAGVYVFQRTLFYRTSAVYQTPAEVKLTGTTEVQLVTADGVHTIAWYWPAPNHAPTLVFFHGNGGSISARHWRVRRAQKMGYGIMLVEYRGFAGREGTPTEEGLYADARAVLDWLEAHDAPSSSTILYGESLGSGIAVKMATERKVAGVILEAPYTSTVDVAALNYWMFPVRALMWDRFDSLSRIKEIRAPLLVMHGGADTTIPQSRAALYSPPRSYQSSATSHPKPTTSTSCSTAPTTTWTNSSRGFGALRRKQRQSK